MSVKATEVLAPRPQDGEAADDPMEEFGRRLKAIVSAKAQLLRERGEQRVVQGLRDNICLLQAERSQLETLCRDVQDHYFSPKDEALRRCREDEEKRSEMAAHFQTSLAEIQAQIQQHSARNEKSG